jgi:hypothetical protein
VASSCGGAKFPACASCTVPYKTFLRRNLHLGIPYFIEYSMHFFTLKIDAEVFRVHYTWKVAENGFKMVFMMNKLAMINSCEIILEN